MTYFKQLLLVVATFSMASSVLAQEDFEDLRNLLMDEKYEKVISKGENYVDNDKTKKDPTPYLYISKAYYEMSRNEKYFKDFPPEKSFANSLKWAAKYRRKDPAGALFEENDLYFRELKESAIREAGGLMSDGKYSRAKRYYDAICDFDPTDPGAWLMLGYCQLQIKNVTEAKLNFKEGGKVMYNRDMSTLNSVERNLLRDGVLNYAEYLNTQSMRDSARATLSLAQPILDGDAEFDMVYKKSGK